MPKFNEKNQNIDAGNITIGTIGAARLPFASAGTVGAIRVGSGLSIDGSGILSATGGGASTSASNTWTAPQVFQADVNQTYQTIAVLNNNVGTSAGIGVSFTLKDASGSFSNNGKILLVKNGTWTTTLSTQTAYMAFEVPDGATQREAFRIHNNGALLVAKTTDDGSGAKIQVNGNVKATEFVGGGSNITGVAKTASGNTFTAPQTFKVDVNQIYYPATLENGHTGTSASVGLPFVLRDTAGSNFHFASIQVVKNGTWTSGNASTQTAYMSFHVPDGLTVREAFRIHHNAAVLVGTSVDDGSGAKLQVNGTVKATAFVGDGSGLTGISGGSSTNYSSSDGMNYMGGF